MLWRIEEWIDRGYDYYYDKERSNETHKGVREMLTSIKDRENAMIKKYFGFRLLCIAETVWTPLYRFIDWSWHQFLYRFVNEHKYNQVRPRTLKIGYHEPYDRLIHAAFELLVQYVEAAVDVHGNRPTPDKIRSKEELINSLGCLNLDPASDAIAAFVDDETKKDSHEFEEFAPVDQEIINLYWWWTRERIPPDEAWDRVPYPTADKQPDIIYDWTDKEYPEYRKYLDDAQRLEEELMAKDQEMLERLVSIYRFLSV